MEKCAWSWGILLPQWVPPSPQAEVDFPQSLSASFSNNASLWIESFSNNASLWIEITKAKVIGRKQRRFTMCQRHTWEDIALLAIRCWQLRGASSALNELVHTGCIYHLIELQRRNPLSADIFEKQKVPAIAELHVAMLHQKKTNGSVAMNDKSTGQSLDQLSRV